MKKRFKIEVKTNGQFSECYEEANYQEEAIQQCLASKKNTDWNDFKILKCEEVSKRNYTY
ncbi:MAG: hypothetical protein N2376_09995 [Clostridia bacterium]|nr:hypothetical protein [Clostridia bacterium]